MFAASLVLTSCGAAAGAQVPAWKANSQVGMTAARSAAEESALNSWKSAHRFDLEHLQRLRPAFDSAVAGL